MKCPNCKQVTARLITMDGKNGKLVHRCDRCPPDEVTKKIVKPYKNKRARKFEKFELPKDVITATQKMRPTIKAPDNPQIRYAASADARRAGKRHTIYEFGSTTRSTRSSRVLTKAAQVLGPNPKLISDDGFKAVFESTVF